MKIAHCWGQWGREGDSYVVCGASLAKMQCAITGLYLFELAQARALAATWSQGRPRALLLSQLLIESRGLMIIGDKLLLHYCVIA